MDNTPTTGIGALALALAKAQGSIANASKDAKNPHFGSKYADLANCRYEVEQAEKMMRREGIRWINSTTKSIEEIATTILRELSIERHVY